MLNLAEGLKQFIQQHRTGLAVFEVQTGSGKTNGAVQAICDVIEEQSSKQQSSSKALSQNSAENQPINRVYFVSPQIKNLPEDDFQKSLKKRHLDYKKLLLRIPSNVSSVKDFFSKPKLLELLPQELLATKAAINLRENLAQLKIAERDAKEYANFTTPMEIYEKKLNEESEPSFRSAVKHFLFDQLILSNRKNKMRLKKEIVKKNRKWLGILYPACLLEERKIILMTDHKMLANIDCIYDRLDITTESNCIIVMDEFDASRKSCNDSLIRNNSRIIGDVLPFFSKLHAGMNRDLPTIFWEADRLSTGENKSSNSFTDFRERINQIYDEYHLQKVFHTEEDDKTKKPTSTSRNYMFFTNASQGIYTESGKYILKGQVNKDLNRVDVKSSYRFKDKNNPEVFNITTLLGRIQSFFLSFDMYLNRVSRTYAALINEKRNEVIDDNAALSTILNLFNISFDEARPFIDMSLVNYKFAGKTSGILDQSIYQKGFSIYEIENSPKHAEKSAFLFCEKRVTPEKIISALARRNLIIGLSATAYWLTAWNYNLNYLKDNLGKNYLESKDSYLMSQMRDWAKRLNEEYTRKVACHYVTMNGKKIWEGVCQLKFDLLQEEIIKRTQLSKDKVLPLFTKLESSYKNVLCTKNSDTANFVIERYIELLFPISDFIRNPNAHVWLFLNFKSLKKKDSEFDRDLVEYFIDSFGIPCKHHFLISGDSYDTEVQKYKEEASNGEKVLLFAPYTTLSTGQNLSYSATRDCPDTVVLFEDNFNPDDKRFSLKDVDGIVLGKISHQYWTPHLESIENPVWYLLESTDEILNLAAHDAIKQSDLKNILCLIPSSNNLFNFHLKGLPQKDTSIIRKRYMVTMIQATGRMSRAFLKNKECCIYISSDVESEMNRKMLEEHMLTPEQTIVSAHIKDDAPIKKSVYEMEAHAEDTSMQCNAFLRAFLRNSFMGKWDESSVRLWKLLRLLCMKYGIWLKGEDFQRDPNHSILSKLYFQVLSGMKNLHFAQFNDFSGIKINFDPEDLQNFKARFAELSQDEDYANHVFQEESVENCQFSTIMKYPGMIDFFKSKGFSLNDHPGDFMMAPPIFQNIYKGGLGEYCGSFILSHFGIKTNPLDDLDIFELFDGYIENGYVDFKHWNNYDVDSRKMEEKVWGKFEHHEALDKNFVCVVNLIDNNPAIHECSEFKHIINTTAKHMLVVPGLMDSNGQPISRHIIKLQDFLRKMKKEDFNND